MEPTKLVFVRHAESARNVIENRAFQSISCSYFQNEADREQDGALEDRAIPLTARGLGQARQTGRGLRETFGVFDRVIHSGYVRTVQTTEGILSAYSDEERRRMPVTENLLIRERDPGYCHNMTIEEVKKHFPWLENYWANGEAFFRVPAGGESVAQMVSGRLFLFLDSLKSINAGKVLVASHGRSILGMRYLLEKWSYEKISRALKRENPPNCGVTSYLRDMDNPAWQLDFENRVYYD